MFVYNSLALTYPTSEKKQWGKPLVIKPALEMYGQ